MASGTTENLKDMSKSLVPYIERMTAESDSFGRVVFVDQHLVIGFAKIHIATAESSNQYISENYLSSLYNKFPSLVMGSFYIAETVAGIIASNQFNGNGWFVSTSTGNPISFSSHVGKWLTISYQIYFNT